MLSTSDVKLLKTLIRTETGQAIKGETPKIIRQIILEETPGIVRQIVLEETPGIVRQIVLEETPGIVRQIVLEETHGIVRQIVQEETLTIIRQETAPLKKAIAKIQRDISTLINYFDREIIDLRTRIERVETHLGLTCN